MVDCHTHWRKTDKGHSQFKQIKFPSIRSGSNVAVPGHDTPFQGTRGDRELAVQSNGMNANNIVGADGHTARDPAVDPHNKSESEFHTFTLVPIPTIVDPCSGHLVRHETVSIGEKQGYSYKFDDIDPSSKPNDITLMLCRYTVWAFSFREKRWNEYHVNDLEAVDYRKKSFDRLVLNVEYKAILKAMVAHHVSKGQSRFKDLVAGKGQGLVILLHGK